MHSKELRWRKSIRAILPWLHLVTMFCIPRELSAVFPALVGNTTRGTLPGFHQCTKTTHYVQLSKTLSPNVVTIACGHHSIINSVIESLPSCDHGGDYTGTWYRIHIPRFACRMHSRARRVAPGTKNPCSTTPTAA